MLSKFQIKPVWDVTTKYCNLLGKELQYFQKKNCVINQRRRSEDQISIDRIR